jgi:hypothetical protein
MSTRDTPPKIPEALREEAIKYLATEIASEVEYLSGLRTRVAFTVLTGPFIVVASILVAFKGPLAFNNAHRTPTHVAIIVEIACYMSLSIYGFLMDNHSTGQCNKWRGGIAALLNGEEVKESHFVFKNYAWLAYPAGFFLVGVAFAALIFIIVQLAPPAVPNIPNVGL